MLIYHVTTESDWEAALASGRYTTSTRGRSLEQEGFIHASRVDQWEGVLGRFYDDVTEPLVLLEIDTDLLGVPVVEEPPAPGVEETFPHVYGPIPTAAVVGTRRLWSRRMQRAAGQRELRPPVHVERLDVDGERFDVAVQPDSPGQYHLTWTSGPNPGYGFSSTLSTGDWSLTTAQLEAMARAFLAEIDPQTGYLPD